MKKLEETFRKRKSKRICLKKIKKALKELSLRELKRPFLVYFKRANVIYGTVLCGGEMSKKLM